MFPSTSPRKIMHMLSVQVDTPITSKDLLVIIASLLKPARLRIRIVGACDSWEGWLSECWPGCRGRRRCVWAIARGRVRIHRSAHREGGMQRPALRSSKLPRPLFLDSHPEMSTRSSAHASQAAVSARILTLCWLLSPRPPYPSTTIFTDTITCTHTLCQIKLQHHYWCTLQQQGYAKIHVKQSAIVPVSPALWEVSQRI